MLKLCLIFGLTACLVGGIPRPIDIDYDDEYEEEGVHICLTSIDSSDPEKECVFPFVYKNFTHHGCPTDLEDKTKRWCSTKTDENGVHIDGGGSWGYCTPGCKPQIFPDELLIASEANNNTQTETCDYTACNGFTLKVDVFDGVLTYGQCQFPAGKDGTTNDYFCFVNGNSACEDKIPDDRDKEGLLFKSTLACKDPNAPLPRADADAAAYYYGGYYGHPGYYGHRYGYGYGLGYRSYYGGYGGYYGLEHRGYYWG